MGVGHMVTRAAEPITVMIGDEDAFARFGLKRVLEEENDITVVGEAADGVEALESIRRDAPHVALLDANLPKLNGAEVARQLQKRWPDVRSRVVLITGGPSDLVQALVAGVRGVLARSRPAWELAPAIRSIAVDNTVLAQPVASALVQDLGAAKRPLRHRHRDVDLNSLTKREREVLHHLAYGRSNAEIAVCLGVKASTIKSHITHLLAKLGLRDRMQAALLASEIVPSRNGTESPGPRW
jgi:DNA-binding NarL/FixJ family response regulator